MVLYFNNGESRMNFFFALTAVVFLASTNVSACPIADKYPDIWWQAIPQEEIKSWEIAPQHANRCKGEVVLSKRNELGIFSNLGNAGFVMDGIHYKSTEGLWQGMKYPENSNDLRLKDPSVVWPYTRQQVYAMEGFEAKKAGDLANALMKKLGIEWVTYRGRKIEYKGSGAKRHYNIIYKASKLKVMQNAEVKNLLLSTGDLKFIADHVQAADVPPAYKYHEIYMKVRNEIRTRQNH